jgi:hypothetical protein
MPPSSVCLMWRTRSVTSMPAARSGFSPVEKSARGDATKM